jgi:hypothetical protein
MNVHAGTNTGMKCVFEFYPRTHAGFVSHLTLIPIQYSLDGMRHGIPPVLMVTFNERSPTILPARDSTSMTSLLPSSPTLKATLGHSHRCVICYRSSDSSLIFARQSIPSRHRVFKSPRSTASHDRPYASHFKTIFSSRS